MTIKSIGKKAVLFASCACMAAAWTLSSAAAIPSSAAVSYMPGVTDSMSWPDYWVRNDAHADDVLADWRGITSLNSAMTAKTECQMYDLRSFRTVEEAGLPERLYASAVSEFQGYLNGKYWDAYGSVVSEEMMRRITGNIRNEDYNGSHAVEYGIITHRTDLRAYPTDEIVTDEQGDVNFDYVQLSSVRVNEPMALLARSGDGRYFYGVTSNCGGWVRAEDVAVCKSRSEWLGAWDLPEDRTLIVTDNRIYLEESNTDPEISGLMLTQGTMLELIPYIAVPGRITNRSPQQNYAVYIPVRLADGSFAKKQALISQHYGVSIGYLPLTKRNILRVAFNMLGDTYGWGGMLGAEDCSGYIRGIYRCFGLELPRNTTWQAEAPALKYDLSSMSDDEKRQILDGLPAGSTLFFRGHEMMYLGTEGGSYYVISAVSSAADPFGPGRIRIRSVVINTLDMKRANNTTWLSNLTAAVIPYLAR
jgi:hypothetical protein